MPLPHASLLCFPFTLYQECHTHAMHPLTPQELPQFAWAQRWPQMHCWSVRVGGWVHWCKHALSLEQLFQCSRASLWAAIPCLGWITVDLRDPYTFPKKEWLLAASIGACAPPCPPCPPCPCVHCQYMASPQPLRLLWRHGCLLASSLACVIATLPYPCVPPPKM